MVTLAHQGNDAATLALTANAYITERLESVGGRETAELETRMDAVVLREDAALDELLASMEADVAPGARR